MSVDDWDGVNEWNSRLAAIDTAVAAERERIAKHFDAKAEDARQKQMRAGNSFCSGNDWSIYGAKVERYKAVAAEIRSLKPEAA